MTLSGPALGAFVLVSVGVIVLLEILSRKASLVGNGGGIVFAENVESFSVLTKFRSFLLSPRRLPYR